MSEKKFNKNEFKTIDTRYAEQQKAIKEICNSLNLVAFYPDYHADKTDNNTVIIYTKEGHKYNKKLSWRASVDEEKGRVCSIQNTDINGTFDLDWMNQGSIDLRYVSPRDVIGKFIKECLTKYNKRVLCERRNGNEK